ncbi:MAG: hypothetical protein WD294_06055 [Phycisphaeraceae bacterium]
MKRLRNLLLGLMVIFGTAAGCSSFETQWEAAGAGLGPADGITGRWVGTWESEDNGHHGDLRAIVIANDDGTYNIHYHATYGTLFTLTYAYDLQDVKAEQRSGGDGAYHLAGDSDLGWFGTYSHQARVTPTHFIADYEASIGDFGSYRMQRPE